MFHEPQVVPFCADVDGTAAFYRRLGFSEAFRTPADGAPKHIDVVLDGFRLGLASHRATREDHGLPTNRDPSRAAVILWCDDTPAAYRALLEAGAISLAEPHRFLDGLLVAWATDPEGHAIQVVQRV
jgi:catechol 2,3-dioxygenase-like lactoylglutathione lyase family enzyme